MIEMMVMGQNSDEINRFPDGATISTDMMFGFLDGNNKNLTNFVNCNENDRKYDGIREATLYGTTSLETRIQASTKEALSELDLIVVQCGCRKPVAGGCRNCLQRELSIRLQNKGFNCHLCNSKWKSSVKIPAGEHTYLEVLKKSSNAKKGYKSIVIELNFKAEFVMGKANESYNKLIGHLPELFVGRAERLKALIKILCSAAKKCMKEKKLHLAPWRKQKYMQAKWLGTYMRTTPAVTAPLPVGYSDRPKIPKVSMLTFDLRENLHGLHYAGAVKVIF
ncbi:Basic helix-loop-helix DNA-binding superfamily protein, putative isoform 1 [Hibiscus syriacus]|uniref:Basic helix-loop-helix DNA-binding superfamily protein, putative isoform 1 n=1 Tax=Hibiscus syriacus TaxID=106335 RepID=A0A6A3ANM7_HIBSY|nr:uncharacterized protein LOC120123928 [Hibiscus syriacus]KAE8706220.1 Basic helix-loop-helix DNA-binding superfamily protein, putative isoform 1 [Hibiscus syriacus]